MKFAIPDEILNKTTKCGHAYSCLTTGKCGNVLMCKVDKPFDKNMLYIKATETVGGVCPYKMSYGAKRGHICTCPVHYAIYEQHEFGQRT